MAMLNCKRSLMKVDGLLIFILLITKDILSDALTAGQPIHLGENVDSPIAAVTALLKDDDESKPKIIAELMVLQKDAEHQDCSCPASYVWKEYARWVKYEETVEEHGARFSHPYITLLNIQSLLQLKNCLRHSSAALLDVNCNTMEQIVVNIDDYEHYSADELLNDNLQHQADPTLGSSKSSDPSIDTTATKSRPLVAPSSISLMKKLPPDTEAAVIFVGRTPHLEVPISQFVRLTVANNFFPEMPEVPIPVKFMFFLLIPQNYPNKVAVDIGRAMGSLMIDEVYSRVAYNAHDTTILADGIEEFLSQTLLIPPGKWNKESRWEPPEDILPAKRNLPAMLEKRQSRHMEDTEFQRPDNALRFTGRLFGGFVEDVKRKKRYYLADFTDAFTGRPTQIVAASLLLFIANVTKIITFGGVMGHMLEKRMGTVENLLSGGICGVLYGLFAGQPLSALSATGPTLIFEFIMFELCKRWAWDFLAMRFWVGCWTALFLMIICASDASVIVATITRFTEEAFATLISVIFIIQAFEELVVIGHEAPLTVYPEKIYSDPCMCNITTDQTFTLYNNFSAKECTSVGGGLSGQMCFFYPDIFLFSILLFIGTFTVAIGLKHFRTSGFLPSKIRNAIADLNVSIAVVVMTGVSVLVPLDVPKLLVPEEFKPTMDRPWLVNPMHINGWYQAVGAILPAIFFTILVFMDQQITAVIVNRKDNQLRKSCGYHLDMFVISILIVVCATFGLPFYVAATVISIMHIGIIHKLLGTCSQVSGHVKGGRHRICRIEFIHICEQRVTAVVAHILIGLTITLTPVMKLVPLAVLLGIFLYMGLVALGDQQFVKRVLIFFMPTKYQPDHSWLRVVHLRRVHLFTLIQIVSLCILYLVKHIKVISMGFPFMLIVMVIIRNYVMDKIFTRKELGALDDLIPSLRELFTPTRKSPTIRAPYSGPSSNKKGLGFLTKTKNQATKEDNIDMDNVQQNDHLL